MRIRSGYACLWLLGFSLSLGAFLPVPFTPTAQADPVWVPPKDTFRATFSYTQGFWDEFFEGGTSSISLPGEVSQFEFSSYAEYVPIENLSIDLAFPIILTQKKFVYLQTDPTGQVIGVTVGFNGEIRDTDRNLGIGDVTLGTKYIFYEDGISLGVRPYVKFPGSYRTGFVVNAPGDGQTDLGLGFLIGRYFTPIRTYLRSNLSLVARLGVPNNQMEFLLEAGSHIYQGLSARVFYQWIEQFGGEQIINPALPIFYPAVEEDSHRFGVGISFNATQRFGVFADYQQTVAGRNTSNTKAFTLGVSVNF